MRVGVRDLTVQPVMTKQRTKSSGGHGAAALGSFEGDEQRGRVSEWPLDAEIVLEGLYGFLGQRQKPLLIAFAEDQHLRLGRVQIFQA
jgi:hypothetical protein